MAHRLLKSDQNNRPGGALQLRLRQYSERPSGPSDLASKTMKSGSPGYEPGVIHLFHERTAITTIVQNRVANNENQMFCIELKLCCILSKQYSMPIIMAWLCSLWKGGSDGVLVWPAMPTIGGVMAIRVKSQWIEFPLWKKCYILAGSKGGGYRLILSSLWQARGPHTDTGVMCLVSTASPQKSKFLHHIY